MTTVFGAGYSSLYDTIYQEKDYDFECDKIEEIIKRHSKIKVHNILDLGCGTGSHAIRLAKRGYEVIGVDRSPDMLEIARGKTENCKGSIFFYNGDIRDYHCEKKYDAVIMMFAVLGYQTTNDDIIAVLTNVSDHLISGGIFITDFWYGPAVLQIKPEAKFQKIVVGKEYIFRFSSGALDVFNQIVNVKINTLVKEGRIVKSEVEETHPVRFFFPQELFLLVKKSELKIRKFISWPDCSLVTEKTWNVCGIFIKE